jgi:hypothetical protein
MLDQIAVQDKRSLVETRETDHTKLFGRNAGNDQKFTGEDRSGGLLMAEMPQQGKAGA